MSNTVNPSDEINTSGERVYQCPVCDSDRVRYWNDNCPNCGVSLDWSIVDSHTIGSKGEL
jgi:hypothetical protein